jgi:hypothetical protein
MWSARYFCPILKKHSQVSAVLHEISLSSSRDTSWQIWWSWEVYFWTVAPKILSIKLVACFGYKHLCDISCIFYRPLYNSFRSMLFYSLLLLHLIVLFSSLFTVEDNGRESLRKVCAYLQDCTASYHRAHQSSAFSCLFRFRTLADILLHVFHIQRKDVFIWVGSPVSYNVQTLIVPAWDITRGLYEADAEELRNIHPLTFPCDK